MKIKKGIFLLSKKTTKNRIIGGVMPKYYLVFKTMFNNYVQDVTRKAREKGDIDSISDIMNGKDGNNMFIRFDKENGEQYAKILPNTLKFLNDWYIFLKIQQEDGKCYDKNFITIVTFQSLK